MPIGSLLNEQSGDLWGKINLINNIGWILQAKGDLKCTMAQFQEGLTIAENIGNPGLKTMCLNNLGAAGK